MRVAAIDAGATRNAFAIVVIEDVAALIKIAFARVWTPSKGLPLDIDREIMPEVVATLKGYGISHLVADAFGLHQVQLACSRAGLTVACEGGADLDRWDDVRKELHKSDSRIVLNGEDGAEIGRQLRKVKSVLTRAGELSIELPREGDGHGDLADAWRRAMREMLKRLDSMRIEGTFARWGEQLPREEGARSQWSTW